MTLAKSEPNQVKKNDNKLPKLNTKQQPPVSEEEMRQAVRTLLLGLGEDPDREDLKDTPKRVVKALKFLTSGYHQSLDELLNGAVFHEDANEMVLVRVGADRQFDATSPEAGQLIEQSG
ncbi:MAG: GTP cyclohydrolase I, partial [Cyanobacteria bacterium P01_A01_bin.40]